jgi:tRNA(Arg) A34 adenosine deaminase TadA
MIRSREEKNLRILERIAEASPGAFQARIASALVLKNEIISVGLNQKKTHPFQSKYASHHEAIYLHSETCAIYNALKRYDEEEIAKSTLYICRMKWGSDSKDFMVRGLAKPCKGCQNAIDEYRIKKVCYTIDGEGYEYL